MNMAVLINIGVLGIPHTAAALYYFLFGNKSQTNPSPKNNDLKSEPNFKIIQNNNHNHNNHQIIVESERMNPESLYSPTASVANEMRLSQKQLVYFFSHNMVKRSKKLQKINMHIGQPSIPEQMECVQENRQQEITIFQTKKQQENIPTIESIGSDFNQFQTLFLLLSCALTIQAIFTRFGFLNKLIPNMDFPNILFFSLFNVIAQLMIFNIFFGLLIKLLNNRTCLRSKSSIIKFYLFYYNLGITYFFYNQFSYYDQIDQDAISALIAIGFNLPIQIMIFQLKRIRCLNFLLAIDFYSLIKCYS